LFLAPYLSFGEVCRNGLLVGSAPFDLLLTMPDVSEILEEWRWFARQLCTIQRELADEHHRSHWLEMLFTKPDAYCSNLLTLYSHMTLGTMARQTHRKRHHRQRTR
jgi:hypothetical protein